MRKVKIRRVSRALSTHAQSIYQAYSSDHTQCASLHTLNHLCLAAENYIAEKQEASKESVLKNYVKYINQALLSFFDYGVQHREVYESVLATLNKMPACAQSAEYQLASWHCYSKLATISVIIGQFSEASDFYQLAHACLAEMHNVPEASINLCRLLARESSKQAGLSAYRCDPDNGWNQYQFSIELLGGIPKHLYVAADYRLLAFSYLRLSQGLFATRERVDDIDQAVSFAVSALSLLGEIKQANFMADDQRLMADIFRQLGNIEYMRASPVMANLYFEKAIAALIAIPPEERVREDKANLLTCRQAASKQDALVSGCFSSLRHYGLFHTTSKTESFSSSVAPSVFARR